MPANAEQQERSALRTMLPRLYGVAAPEQWSPNIALGELPGLSRLWAPPISLGSPVPSTRQNTKPDLA